MKSTLFILLLFAVSMSKLNAQSKLKEGSIKATKETFNVKASGGTYLEVNNTSNPNFDTIESSHMARLTVVKMKDEKSIYVAVSKVFSKDRLKDLVPETNFVVNYYINGKGEVKFLKFNFKNNTSVTPVEIEALEKAIKEDVTFSLPNAYANVESIWPITQVVFFDRVR